MGSVTDELAASKPKSRARRMLPLREIKPAQVALRPRGPRPPGPTDIAMVMNDQLLVVYYDDGSLRRGMSKRQTKAQKKAMKKARVAANAAKSQ